eukprot:236895-Alexandrium_andersonii.AAC.1
MVHVRMVSVTADLADLASALAVGEALGRAPPSVRSLLRAQLRRVARPLAVAAHPRRRPRRDSAHVARIDAVSYTHLRAHETSAHL